MSKIREYAKKCGHEIVGKLTRHPELEIETDGIYGEKRRMKERFYRDEGGNEYWVGERGVCIVDAVGGVL